MHPISQARSSPFQIIWMMESLNIEKKLAADLMAFLDPWATNLLRDVWTGMSDGKAATARQFDSLPQNMSWIRLQGLCDFVWSFWLIFSLLRETFPNWCPLWLCEACGCKARKCNWLRHLEPKKNRDGVENGGGRDTGGEGEGTGRRSWNCSPYTSTTVIARVSSILVNNCHHFLVLPCFTPSRKQKEPTTSKDDDDSGDVTWVEFVKGMSSDQFQAWPMFPGDGDQWVEMYSNNVPEWLDFDNFFCGIQHFKQNWNWYGNQRWTIIDWYQWCWVLIAVGQTWLIHGQIIAWTSINMQSRFCPWNCLDEVLFPRITLEALVAIPSSLRRHKHLGHSCGFAKKFV